MEAENMKIKKLLVKEVLAKYLQEKEELDNADWTLVGKLIHIIFK